ncbi:MAG: sugar transferase [Candidatus Dormibacteraeota bacterium]|nr:sugar transferase [Candidatus Dormibacteraeota bacterium]
MDRAERNIQPSRGGEHGARNHRVELHVKRTIDVVFAIVMLALLSPFLAVIAVAIRLDSKGPVLFIQSRVGLRGREFKMLKFRTMCQHAERLLPGLAHLNRGGAHLIRIEHDPRVTRVGGVLRHTSLDELPQLVNVIKGDMSLVGPRPQAPHEVALYSSRERRRLSVPAGMTGLWQITGRDSPSFEEWVRRDLEYIERWNLGLDLQILLRTPFTILARLRHS